MKPHEMLKERRIQLNISDVELSRKINLSVCQLSDIEEYEDEIYSIADIGDIKKLCDLLKMDLFELFDIKCAFCFDNEDYLDKYDLPRNKLIALTKKELVLSSEELGDIVGFKVAAIDNMENDPDFLSSWSYDLVVHLSEVLKLPKQILLGIQCPDCKK
jgi:transcriptional regulator with XRE-family HTH domain